MKRRRAARFTAVTLCAGLLLAALATWSVVHTTHERAAGSLDQALTSEALQHATELDAAIERASDLALLEARNPALASLLAAPPAAAVPAANATPSKSTNTTVAAAAQPSAQGDAIAALQYLNSLFDGSVVAASVVADDGRELVRVVRDEAVPEGLLSPDVSRDPVVAATRALAPGQVYFSTPHQSVTTNAWVLSIATAVPAQDGQRAGIVQFEWSVAALRSPFVAAAHRVRVIDADTGVLVADSTRALSSGSIDASSVVAALRDRSDADRLATVAGQRAAARPTRQSLGNQNRWLVVVSANPPPPMWRAFAGLPLALVALSIVLLLASVFSRRSFQTHIDQAFADELTGLPSRRVLIDRVDQALAGAQRDNSRLAVMVIDLNGFKEVNDTLGHLKGDVLLREVSQRFQRCLRDVDTVARLGGDEFAVLLPAQADATAARAIAQRLARSLDDPVVLDNLPVQIGGSIGIALYPDHGTDTDGLLRRADVAMYEAKRHRTGIETYAHDRDPHSPQRLALTGELRGAIRNAELTLHYQPRVSLRTDRVVGVEALVRWPHPTHGLLLPDLFLPLAEQTGLTMELTEFVLEEALEQLRTWNASGFELTMSINLSPATFRDPELPALVRQQTLVHRVRPSQLVLELTENTVMHDAGRAQRVLTLLRALGTRVSVDEFGAGLSSLTNLRRLRFDELKIDRSLVRRVCDSDADAAVVRTTVELCHSLGLLVVAEGVESSDELDALARLGCDVVLGYALCAPLSADELGPWLAAHPTVSLSH